MGTVFYLLGWFSLNKSRRLNPALPRRAGVKGTERCGSRSLPCSQTLLLAARSSPPACNPTCWHERASIRTRRRKSVPISNAARPLSIVLPSRATFQLGTQRSFPGPSHQRRASITPTPSGGTSAIKSGCDGAVIKMNDSRLKYNPTETCPKPELKVRALPPWQSSTMHYPARTNY